MSFFRKIKKKLRKKLGLLPPSFEDKVAPLVSSQAHDIINAHKSGKALFIDMGSNLGQGFSFFSKYYDPNVFDYWLIEANPFCIDKLKNNVSKLYESNSWEENWKISNIAISNKNGILKLYGLVEDTKGETSVGASVVKDHNSAKYDSNEEEAIEVTSVNVSELIQDASKEYSTIVVKMDIESSEYDALDELIRSGHIDKISHIYVEWHSQYFSDEKRDDILIRENNIKTQLGTRQTDWH